MRIADVSAFYTADGGGVRTYVERKLAYAEAEGVELAVIVPGEADRVEPRGRRTRLIHIASPRLILDRRYRYFAKAGAVHAALDAFAPEVVEASSPWRTASIVAEWRGQAVKALVMHADPLAAYAYRWFGGVAPRETIDRGFDWFWAHLRRTSRHHDMIVAPNPHLAARLTEGGLGRVRTVPLGIEPGLFSPTRRDPALRATLLARCGLDPDALLLVGVGRHAPEKRWPIVVGAAARAGVSRRIGLVLVGEGRDRARIMRHIGDNPHIVVLPPTRSRDDLAAFYASADALIHGCEAETFGLVPAEAVASGLPLIVPDAGGAAGQAHPASGERYRAGDVSAATSAVLRLATRQPETLRRAALQRAASARTMDAHFAELLLCYAGLADRSSRVA